MQYFCPDGTTVFTILLLGCRPLTQVSSIQLSTSRVIKFNFYRICANNSFLHGQRQGKSRFPLGRVTGSVALNARSKDGLSRDLKHRIINNYESANRWCVKNVNCHIIY